MDRTPTSFPSSPVAYSSRDEQTMLKATSTYSSPLHAVPLDRYDFQPLSGLGISNCEAGSPSDQIRLYPCPEQYALSTSNWSDPITRSPNFLETPPDVSHFPHYEPFGSRADVSVSPSYSPVMDFRVMHDEMSRYWPNTPPSETAVVSEGWTNVKEQPEEIWDASLIDGANNPTMSTMPQLPRLQINTTFIHPQRPDETQIELDASREVPAEVVSEWIEDVNGSPLGEKLKIPSASGLECTTCGLRFTRRSNCREHMKSHDPTYVRQHPCETCGREFRRRTDLKRHVDSIHKGIRKYGCEKCGRRYSRQDTLSRHLLDGCDGRTRKSRTPRRDSEAKLSGSGP